jgi:AcrR family transcriptional regulator
MNATEHPGADATDVRTGVLPVVAAAEAAGLPEVDRRAPGRPRSARADEAIIEAVLDLLAEGSTIEALSIEAVANRAGVGKATIYRRWPNKETLVIDAIGELKGAMPEVSGVSVRDDLLALLRPMATASDTRAGRIIPCLIPEIQRNKELYTRYQRIVEPRRAMMRQVVRDGMASGQLRADLDVEVVVGLLVAPMIVQTVLKLQPDLDVHKLPEQIVDALLPGMLA